MTVDQQYVRVMTRDRLIRELEKLAELAFQNNVRLDNDVEVGALLAAIVHDLKEQEKVN